MPQIRVLALANLPGQPRGTVADVEETPLVLALIRKGRLKVVGKPKPTWTEPPRGTISELMRWIGEDEERAYEVLDVELQTGAPRQTLIRRIDTLLGVTGSPESAAPTDEAHGLPDLPGDELGPSGAAA